MKKLLAFLLLLCLLAVLCGCDQSPGATAAPTTTEAPPPMPAPTGDRLELDGRLLGPVCAMDGQAYVALRTLTAATNVSASETAPGVLKLALGDSILTLQAETGEAVTGEGEKKPLGAPVLRDGSDWYLPLTVLEAFGSRGTVYDGAEKLFRSLRLEPGPAILRNGGAPTESLLWGGVPTLPADCLAELLGGSAAQVSDPDGTPVLTLEADGLALRFREGAGEARFCGAAAELPVPARREGESWYLPAALTAEALGGVVLEDGAGSLSIWLPETGPAVWLDGVGLETLRFGDTLCAELSAMAEALGGTAEPEADRLRIELGDHSLVFRADSPEYESDGKPGTLPTPVFCLGEARYASVSAFAAAVGLPAAEGEKLSFSRMEPRETLLWIDGRETAAYALPEGPLYLRLGDAAEPVPAEEAAEVNTARFLARGRELTLEGGAARLLLDGEPLELSAPVYADSGDWYAPAAELLTALGLSELKDPELDQIYYTHIVKNDSLEEGCRVPVLMYHAVSDYLWGIPELFVSPSKLEDQLKAITEGGYTAVTFEDLDRIAEIEKPVMLTFDDGYDDNYTELFPLLQKYNVKATVFVIVNDLGKAHKLTKAQVKEMSDSGLVSIQSHTMSHNYLTGMYEKQLRYEHYDSMLALARITGKQPFVMCYPTGKNSWYTRSITAEYYQYGLCMGGPCYVTGGDPYYICRYYIPRNTSLDTFLSYLDG